MDTNDAKRRWRGGETALGGLLLLLGILVLAGQAVDVDVGEVGWPFSSSSRAWACWADGCWPPSGREANHSHGGNQMG